MYVDSLKLLQTQVGYGDVGMNGDLGYEGLPVTVGGKPFPRALSTHPPARLRFHVDRRFASFNCQVALNDDVPAGASHADFAVVADGREIAVVPYVQSGEPPRPLTADIAGAEHLELVVRTSRWEYCHAVWLDPEVSQTPTNVSNRTLIDCLGRAEVELPAVAPRAEKCIATVVSPNFEPLLDDMLGSLAANGRCHDALLVVFALGMSKELKRVAAKYGATVFRCGPRTKPNPTSKAVMYSIAYAVDAQQFICLDADMLVLGDLRPVFGAIDACPPGSILAVREGNGRGWHGFQNLSHALKSVYGGKESDFRKLLSNPNGEGDYTLVVNDGLFAGSREALLGLDNTIRSMPHAVQWTDERRDIWWRNQFVFNLALAQMKCGVELDPVYNVQLNSHDVEISEVDGRLQADWFGRVARVLHYNGLGRNKNPEWRGRFSKVASPLVTTTTNVDSGADIGGDSYETFLAALRAWIGRRGLQELAWSFYGTTDALNARVHDANTFPLFATLHYLIRSNGVVRVLETGTARGVSAACLASAVAHRLGGRVVTMDPFTHPGREELWATLPENFRSRIEARQVDALAGMQSALDAGERYEAAILDSLHEAEHVWAEFQLATQLVCPGGLILIHDATYTGGTVPAALERIEAGGYNVVKLWAAEEGVREDDRLGLALIENRRRAPSPAVESTAASNGHANGRKG
jgi:predicted O-methyltransferase YrrM